MYCTFCGMNCQEKTAFSGERQSKKRHPGSLPGASDCRQTRFWIKPEAGLLRNS